MPNEIFISAEMSGITNSNVCHTGVWHTYALKVFRDRNVFYVSPLSVDFKLLNRLFREVADDERKTVHIFRKFKELLNFCSFKSSFENPFTVFVEDHHTNFTIGGVHDAEIEQQFFIGGTTKSNGGIG